MILMLLGAALVGAGITLALLGFVFWVWSR